MGVGEVRPLAVKPNEGTLIVIVWGASTHMTVWARVLQRPAPPSSVSPTGAATHPQAAPNGLAYGDYSGRQSPPAAETVEIAA
jgi:hypothetical protein